MKYKQIWTIIFSLIMFVHLNAQDMEISMQQTFGNELHNFSYSILPLNDGGYYLLADTETDTSSMDYLIVKVLADGSVDWQKNFGGEGVERPAEIISDDIGGFYVIGSSSSKEGEFSNNHGLFDVWFAHFSSVGKLLWHKNYGGSGIDNGLDIVKLESGNFLIGGTTSSSDIDIDHNKGMTDIWLIEIDVEGNVLWEKTYGGSDNEYFGGVLVDQNDSIFVVGGTKSNDGDISFNHGDKDVWLIKTDNEGNLLRENTFGGSDSDDGQVIRNSHTGNLIITAITKSEDGDITKSFGLNDYWILEIDSEANLLWQRSFGGSRNDAPKDMLVTDDGYLVGGTTYSFDGNITENKGQSDVWMLKIYPDGVMAWQKTFGGSGVESCTKIVYSKFSNYITANNTDSFDFDVENSIGETDLWLVDYCESFVTVDKVDICEGDSLLWDGNYYNESGFYTADYMSKCGLDSIKHLYLNNIQIPDLEMITGDDWVVEQTEHTYSVAEFDNTIYHWSTNHGFFKDTTFLNTVGIQWIVSGNGEVSVYAIKKEICSTDTVHLNVYVSGVGVDENDFSEISIYPNPSSNGIFNLKGIDFKKIEIYNSLGGLISDVDNNSTDNVTIDISQQPKGVYFLKMFSGSSIIIRKLVYN